MVELIECYFVSENAGEIEAQLSELIKPFMHKCKRKSYTDNDEEVEEFSFS